MKKMIIMGLSLFALNTAQADPVELNIKISGLAADKPHFLCLYGAGCYNMRSAEKGKVFPLNQHVMSNLKKIFIADMRTKQLYAQPITDSCRNALNTGVHANSKLVISGKLAVKDTVAKIENLHCELA